MTTNSTPNNNTSAVNTFLVPDLRLYVAMYDLEKISGLPLNHSHLRAKDNICNMIILGRSYDIE
jgi:hypothetical protein